MTGTTTPTGTVRSGWWTGALPRVRARDPELLAIKRSIRAAVVMPTVFALTHLVTTNPQVGLFGAFGSFALLLLVDFPGRTGARLSSYLALFLVGIVFITLGTVVSQQKVLAVVAMAIVGFGVLFIGIVSPQAVTASTAALLMFVLPVAVAQPVGERRPPPRRLGVRGCLLHSGVHAALAHSLARHAPASPRVDDLGCEPVSGESGRGTERSEAPAIGRVGGLVVAPGLRGDALPTDWSGIGRGRLGQARRSRRVGSRKRRARRGGRRCPCEQPPRAGGDGGGVGHLGNERQP